MPIKLDLRLKTIADLVDYGVVADIGCDHGKLGYYLIGTEKASRVIATDISKPSLDKAKELAYENGVSHLIDTRLGDGLKPIGSGEVDTVVIAGMGGDLISQILEQGKTDKKEFDQYVLSPNVHSEKVRRTLQQIGQEIVFDDIVFVAGKYYNVIKSKKSENIKLTDNEIIYGKFYKTSSNFRIFAKKEIKKLETIANNVDDVELNLKVKNLKEALLENVSE